MGRQTTVKSKEAAEQESAYEYSIINDRDIMI